MSSGNIARILGLLLVVAAGCEDAGITPPKPRPREGVSPIVAPTYDRSGETVHPDFAAAPDWWHHDGPDYLGITPYPDGDASKENPSLFHGAFDQWAVPDGGPNPVLLPSGGYFSDPDVLFNADTREIWMYFRHVDRGNVIRLMRSSDGVHWLAPRVVVQGPSHTIVSPAIVRRGTGDWLMWSVNSGAAGCNARVTTLELRRSADGLTWTAPETVDMPPPPSGLMPWHIDVQWIPSRSEFWAVYNAKDDSNCGTTALYFATSPDGVHWTTRATPILVAGAVAELNDIVYRTTFDFDASAGQITFWYSGARRGGRGMIWSTMVEQRPVAALFAAPLAMARTTIPASVVLTDPP
jgi:hypothetical protein